MAETKSAEEIAAAEKAAAEKAAGTKKAKRARVIVDHGEYRIDQVLEGAAAEAAVRDGLADDHPTAVAYAEKLARRKAREAADAED
jgi:hypothetical protein